MPILGKNMILLRFCEKFPKQCSHCRGSGGDSGTGRFVSRFAGAFLPSTFVRRRGTWCMLPRSRAGKKVGRARKTQWFQHTFPLRPESGPAGSREILGGSRGPLDVPPGVSGGAPRTSSGVLLSGSFLQDAYSEIPLQVILLGDSSCRIPAPRIPLLEFPLEDSSARIPLSGFLLQDFPAGFLS